MSLNKMKKLPSEKFEVTKPEFHGNDSEIENIQKEYDVIIVGGGLSGLTAAWQLKSLSVLLLEERNKFGGNARLESRDGLRYASAGSCFQNPVEGGEVAGLLDELGLRNQWQAADQESLVLFDTRRLLKGMGEVCLALINQPKALLNPAMYKLSLDLIKGAITKKPYIVAPKKLGDPVFAKLYEYLEQFKPGSGKYPAVPWSEGCDWSRQEMELFDSISLYDLFFDPTIKGRLPIYLQPKDELGELVKDAIETTLRVECLSIKDVSAYVGLHFLLGYLFGTLVTFPGGNGFLSEQLKNQLEKESSYHSQSTAQVTAVEEIAGSYEVTYLKNQVRYKVKAATVIWAAPKFVAQHVLNNIPNKQRQAISEIEHRDYCIANVFLKKTVLKSHFGGYVIEGAHFNKKPYSWCRSGVCLVANWKDKSFDKDIGVLTLLKPVFGEKDQGKLKEVSFDKLQAATYQEVVLMFAALGLSPEIIEDIKIWRWNKGLVVPKVGQLKNDVFIKASAPIRGVFFANQDTNGLGNLESAVGAGIKAAKQVKNWLESNKQENFISVVSA
ncbi:NAD(P)-binding protein [Zooshikella marina]|uniref:NAD(P)/FAD-dependent oxidoreductase n=2 Tax=Zooshikella ganghwensis TaxID=202772 RepID=UPI001C05C210|nr:NAD(P)/FAD-dependent oxidoreductase [Zooshikella ganghwensis]MBU2704942.1 NAD(P)-binding protein [Zooshikella ganghwensis]